MPRNRFAKQSLGTFNGRIKESRVLMVGAGGIGCELLKNLVLCGFGHVHVVDLDTIDLSNLNRQFLFRHDHIKKSKALVAKETAGRFNPNVHIEAYHANIKDPRFDLDWFKSFALVFNALDNLEARRYVNKMCLAADVPLIESGTTGWNGQVQVIKKGQTECYDCTPKEIPKSFPVCTIRSTPSQPIHCVVWAKSYLFAELFGTSEDNALELDNSEDAENAEEITKLKGEAEELKRLRQSMGSEEFPRKLFEKVFARDIERLRNMEEMWRTRQKPEALDFGKLSTTMLDMDASIAEQDQVAWTSPKNLAVFVSSTKRLVDQMERLRTNATTGNASVLTFDKDDNDALDFVTASANLRSIVFGLAPQSKFEIKQMAGNIIPAIATTNAMTAGLCVLQAFKILREGHERARNVFLSKTADRVISSEPLLPPKPDCPVCGVSQARVEVDLTRATLNDVVEGLLRTQLSYGHELSITSDAGILYDPELDDNLTKKLSDLGIKQGDFLTVTDEEDDQPRVNLQLFVSEACLPLESQPIIVKQRLEIARRVKHLNAPITNGHGHRPADVATRNGDGLKRKRNADDAEDEADTVRKRGKVFEEKTSGTLDDNSSHVLDDSNNGAILIDDD